MTGSDAGRDSVEEMLDDLSAVLQATNDCAEMTLTPVNRRQTFSERRRCGESLLPISMLLINENIKTQNLFYRKKPDKFTVKQALKWKTDSLRKKAS
jgi:hypothetical protein